MGFIPKTEPRANDFGVTQAIDNAAGHRRPRPGDKGHGGVLATSISAVALIFSGVSYYESSIKSAQLSVYVPAMVHYARDGGDVFNVPVTITNDGAKNGTVLSMTLDVENLDPNAARKKATFHGIFIGDYPRDEKVPLKSYAPLSIPGHGTFSETVRFYNMGETTPYLVNGQGDFRFTLKLATARPKNDLVDGAFYADPKPLTFDLNLPYLSVQTLNFRNGTQALYSKEWQAAVSQSGASAAEQRLDKSAPEPDGGTGGDAGPAETNKPAEQQ